MQITEYDKETNDKGDTMILVTVDTIPDTWVVLCSLDQFCDWLEKTEDLSDYKETGYSDNGEGEYSTGDFIDWQSVLYDHLNIDFLQKYLTNNQIKLS